MTLPNIRKIVEDWLVAHSEAGKPSRNTVATGIVVLDTIARLGLVAKDKAFTDRGELMGARSALSTFLKRRHINPKYLKEVTTRQAANDGRALYEALDWGKQFELLSEKDREIALGPGLSLLRKLAEDWLNSKHLELACDPQNTPLAWIEDVLDQGKKRSGGKVEQHLIGAKLERRFSAQKVPNQPGNAADVQTGRSGDFALGRTVFHVTVSPSGNLIEKCARNLQAGLRPVVVVPRNKVRDAVVLASDKKLEKRIVVLSIEEFIASNIIELAEGEDTRYLEVMKEIIEIYNRRLGEVETDLSLQIDIE